MSASRQERAYTVACKDEFEVAERGGDSADGRNRDHSAKTFAIPLSNSPKGDFGDKEKDTRAYPTLWKYV